VYLTQALHRSVQHHPDAVMTICGERVRTFADVADRVAHLAGGLRELGLGRGDRVAVLALNSDRYSELLLATPWADAVVNPVNTRWSPAEIAYSLNDSGSAVIVVDDVFAPMLSILRKECPGLRATIFCGDGTTPDGCIDYEDLVGRSAPIPDARRGGDALAGIFYTGGTTGLPKGVMLSHTNLVTTALGAAASRAVFRSGGTLLHVAPMFHLADLTGWNVQLVMGGTHVLLPTFDVETILQTVERHGVTGLTLVPSMIQMILNHSALEDYDLSSVESVLYGGSAITESLLKRAMEAFPKTSFTQAYGMTELAGLATFLTPEQHADSERLRSAGRSIPHTEVRIVDSGGAEVPVGETGEVTVRGGQVMGGYWNRPEETAAALRDGWLHTGDVGRLDKEGFLFVVDRLKDMIVSGGENVYSAEVENAIASHPGVAACAVIGLPDADWGERVHAVVVRRPGVTVAAEEIRDHVGTLIARYKAPRSVEFADELPVSAAGKVLKRQLRDARI